MVLSTSSAHANSAGSGRQAPLRRSQLEDLERELKFVVPVTRADLALRCIRTLMVADRQFAEADVWTVYYDTPDFSSMDEKLNSDYLKMKVRVRWYAPVHANAEQPAFVEAKLRIGNRRDKVRVELPVGGGALAGRSLDDQIFRSLPRLLAAEGILVGPSWQPMLALRYRRCRFFEQMSGLRLNFDSQITAVGVNHRHLFASQCGSLPWATVEIKGFCDVLPARLHPLIGLGIRKEGFSKYAALFLHVRRRAV